MGSLTRRIRQGLAHLAGAVAAVAIVFWAASSLRVPGELWTILAVVFIGCFTWEGFRADPPPRRFVKVLRTPRLVLRRALPADADALHAMLSDTETTRYWHAPAHTAREETDTWFQRILAPEKPEWCDDFILIHRGRVIGMLGSLHLPWVSFLLSRDQWGKGLAGEALAAFARYMFDRGLPYLYAATDARNAAARALLVSGGFHEVGRSTRIWKVQDLPAEAVHYRLNRDGTDPDLEEERALIETMEADATRLASGDSDVEQLEGAGADQQPEQQKR